MCEQTSCEQRVYERTCVRSARDESSRKSASTHAEQCPCNQNERRHNFLRHPDILPVPAIASCLPRLQPQAQRVWQQAPRARPPHHPRPPRRQPPLKAHGASKWLMSCCAQNVLKGVISSRYTETTDAYCSNAMDDDDPSILSRYDSFENCWEYCASETSCAACFQPCLDGTGGLGLCRWRNIVT